MNEQTQAAQSIIRSHLVWSMGAGLIPVPIADFFAVGAIQLDMVRQLCKLYEVDFKETEGKAIISALTSSLIAKLGARAALKLIPGVGSIVGGAAMAILSGASTYAIGEVFRKHFETGGTILDFDTERLKKMYNELFEKGKDIAKEIKDEQEEMKESVQKEKSSDKTIQKLRELAEMKEQGILTQEEFEQLKKRLI